MSSRTFGIGIGNANCSNGANLHFEKARNCRPLRPSHSGGYIPPAYGIRSQPAAAALPQQRPLRQHQQPQQLRQQKENQLRRYSAEDGNDSGANFRADTNNGAYLRQALRNQKNTVFAERSDKTVWPPGSTYRAIAGPRQSQQSNLQQISSGFRQGMKDVPQWLKGLRLHKYTELFSRMTYTQLMGLDECQLEKCDVTQGARRKILQSVQSLRERIPQLLDFEMAIGSQKNSAVVGKQADNLRVAIGELRAIMNTPIGYEEIGGESKQTNSLPNCIFRLVVLLHDILFENNSQKQSGKLRNLACLDDEYIIRLSQVHDKIMIHEAFTGVQKQKIGGCRRLLRQHIQENGIRYNFGFGSTDVKLPYSISSGYKNQQQNPPIWPLCCNNLQKQQLQYSKQQQQQPYPQTQQENKPNLQKAKVENCQPQNNYANLHTLIMASDNCGKFEKQFANASNGNCQTTTVTPNANNPTTVTSPPQFPGNYNQYCNQYDNHQQQQQPKPPQLQQHQPNQFSDEQKNNFHNWLMVLRDYHARQQIGAISQGEIAAANQILLGILRNFPEFNEMMKKYTSHNNTEQQIAQQQTQHQQKNWNGIQKPSTATVNSLNMMAQTREKTVMANNFEMPPNTVLLAQKSESNNAYDFTQTLANVNANANLHADANLRQSQAQFERKMTAPTLSSTFKSWSPFHSAQESAVSSPNLPLNDDKQSLFPPNSNAAQKSETSTNTIKNVVTLSERSSSSGYSSSDPSGSDRSSGAGSPPGLMVYNFFEDSLSSGWTLDAGHGPICGEISSGNLGSSDSGRVESNGGPCLSFFNFTKNIAPSSISSLNYQNNSVTVNTHRNNSIFNHYGSPSTQFVFHE